MWFFRKFIARVKSEVLRTDPWGMPFSSMWGWDRKLLILTWNINNILNFLGFRFDNKLNWKPHILSLKSHTSKDLNMFRMLSNITWGSDFKTMIKMYKATILPKLDYGSHIYDSAKESYKKPLNTIQNQALRYITGAFRTSPILSLQCISGIPALSSRRQHLLLKYISSLKFRNNLPDSHNILNSSLKNIPASLLSRSIMLTNQMNPPLPIITPSILPSLPPWLLPPIIMDLSLQNPSYSLLPIKPIFLTIINEKYKNYTKIYTDGSKSKNAVGSAVFSPHFSLTYKHNTCTSIFSAELYAIYASIKHLLLTKNHSQSLIITDSLSSLKAINSPKSSNPLITKIKDLLLLSSNKKLDIKFMWVPGHRGISGNDEADRLAKLACQEGHEIQSIFSPLEHKATINNFFKNLTQLEWDLISEENKLWEIKKDFFTEYDFPSLTRRENVICRRLAIGHTYLTHSFLLKKDPPPTCSFCNTVPTSVKHILSSCPALEPIRTAHNLPQKLSESLHPSPKNLKIVIEFAKLIGIHKNI